MSLNPPLRDDTSVEMSLPVAETAMKWSFCGAFGWLIGVVVGLLMVLVLGPAGLVLPSGPVTDVVFGSLLWVSVLVWPVFSLVALPYASFLTFRAFFQVESRKQRWYGLVINLLAWGVGGLPSLMFLALAVEEAVS